MQIPLEGQVVYRFYLKSLGETVRSYHLKLSYLGDILGTFHSCVMAYINLPDR